MTSLELLQNLLRVRSVNPPGDEEEAAALLEAYLGDAGLKTEIVASPEGRPNLIARVEGPGERPPLVLLSHSDVVPVEEDKWTRDPFGGEIYDGFVWGRGALDMKSIAAMHAVAAADLAGSNRAPGREVIVAFVADEEAGGREGARWLVEEHPELVGFGEGTPPPDVLGEGAYGLTGVLDRPIMPITLGEKTAVWIEVIADGDPGHGAVPPARQAPVNLAALIGDLAGFGTPRVHPVMREHFAELAAAASGTRATLFRALASPAGGTVARAVAAQLRKASVVGLLLSDSITPTQIATGYKANVVPAEGRAFFDCRLLPDTDVDEFVEDIERKVRRRGGRLADVERKNHGPVSGKGDLFEILEDRSRDIDGSLPVATLTPGITDLRFFRARGATAYGWCPLLLTPELLATVHGHDERVGVDDFNRGVTATTDIVIRAAT